jgi:hypothetical protein
MLGNSRSWLGSKLGKCEENITLDREESASLKKIWKKRHAIRVYVVEEYVIVCLKVSENATVVKKSSQYIFYSIVSM